MIHITLVFEEYIVVQIHPAVIPDGESNMCMSITSYYLMIENTDNCKIHINAYRSKCNITKALFQYLH